MSEEKSIKIRILIEIPTWIGDCVMATPAIENIIKFYDNPDVVIIGSKRSINILEQHPNVIASHVLNKKYLQIYKLSKKLGKFNAFFSFRNSMRTKILKFCVSSKNKYKYSKYKNQQEHQVERYNEFVNTSLNINHVADELKIYTNETDAIIYDKPTLGINPGAAYGNAKRWYPIEFAKVAQKLSHKYDILILGGNQEIDIATDVEKHLISMEVKNYKNIAAKTTITELINNIAALDLLITGDSGPMHIAGAFQVPTIAIFGPTKNNETSQWRNKSSIIVKKILPCQPCMNRECHLKHHKCMTSIKAQDVLTALNKLALANI